MSSYVECTETEFMISQAAGFLEDHSTFFVGFGLPQIVAILAQNNHAPHLIQVFEFGAIAPLPVTPFVKGTMGGPQNTYRSIQWCNMNISMSYAAAGYIDFGMLGAAQIDRFGNINSTLIGNDYKSPSRRFPGSGGGNQVASYCWRTIVVMKHEPRRFVENVDFITSPGYLTGGKARDKSGLPSGTGIWKVVTSKAVFGFHPESREMILEGIRGDQDVDRVFEGMGFTPNVSSSLVVLSPPGSEELELLRDNIDPSRIIIGGELISLPRT
jgi:glutaconate CoA-transferase subunit B